MLGREDDSHGEYVVNLLKRDVLVLHLVPDGVGAFYSLLDGVFYSHLVECLLDRACKLVEEFVSRLLCRFEFVFYRGILIRVLIFKTEVFQFGFYLVKTESVGERGIDIQSLSCNLVFLVGRLTCQCAHVMQSVAYLNKDYAYVVAHGEQQLLEVLSLCRSLFTEYSTAYLGESIHNLRHLGTEDVLDILHGIVGILHHVVEKSCTYTRRTESHLLASYLRHCDGMHYIRFARQTPNTLVRLLGKVECLGDKIHLLAMSRLAVCVQQMLVCTIDHQFVLFLNLFLLVVHNSSFFI